MTRVPALIPVLRPRSGGGAGQTARAGPLYSRATNEVNDMSSGAVSSPTTGPEDARGRGAASAQVGMFAYTDSGLPLTPLARSRWAGITAIARLRLAVPPRPPLSAT